jgi:hypothetical protein
MGIRFELESEDDENLIQSLTNVGLTKNWRKCGGVGCYTLLQALLRHDPYYDDRIDLETMKLMYNCVIYFIENKKVCDENDIPQWCKDAYDYEKNLDVKLEINEYTLQQAIKLAQWFEIGINHHCTIYIG